MTQILEAIDRLVERTIDRERLVEKIDQLQIGQEYLEDSGGENLKSPQRPEPPN